MADHSTQHQHQQHHGKGGGLLNKAQKQLVRTKAKVLQNLGKADKTTDQTFETHVQNFTKVQENVLRLQKQLKNYIMCAKGLAVTSKDLGDVLMDLYEPSFPDQSDMHRSINDMELMWNDYLVTLEEQCTEHITRYQQAFPDIKNRISKRSRKIVDYDNARHNVEYLLNAKKQDPPKIAKAQEDLHECKKIYEQLNNELLIDLPEIFKSRIPFQSLLLQNIYNAETLFHENVAKTSVRLIEVAEKLGRMEEKTSAPRLVKAEPVVYDNRLPTSPTSDSPRVSRVESADGYMYASAAGVADTSLADMSGINLSTLDKSTVDKSAPPVELVADHGDSAYENIGIDSHQVSRSPVVEVTAENEKPPHGQAVNEAQTASRPTPNAPHMNQVVADESSSHDIRLSEDDENLYQVPSNEPLTKAPNDCLFQVIASHMYNGEDTDELSLVPGEMIYVIPCDNEEDQDEGWLYGMRQSDGQKGFFPENFTKRM